MDGDSTEEQKIAWYSHFAQVRKREKYQDNDKKEGLKQRLSILKSFESVGYLRGPRLISHNQE